jgi:hypothetical protein
LADEESFEETFYSFLQKLDAAEACADGKIKSISCMESFPS